MADANPQGGLGDRQEFAHHFDSANTGEGPFHVKGGDKADVIPIPKEGWKRVSTPCANGQHDPVLDETEKSVPGHVGYKCRRCKIGWIVKEEQMVNN